MQLMPRRTQHMQSRRLAAQHVLAEINRHKTAGLGRPPLCFRPIPFWSDGKGHRIRSTRQKIPHPHAPDLHRRDPLQSRRHGTERLINSTHRKNLRQHHMPALFGRLDRDLPPFVPAFLRIHRRNLDHTPLRLHRMNRGRPQFRRLLHQPVEPLIFDQRDNQVDLRLHPLLPPLAQNFRPHHPLPDFAQFRLRRPPRPIENFHPIPQPQTQHLRRMPRLGIRKHHAFRAPHLHGNKKTSHDSQCTAVQVTPASRR